MIWWFVSHFSKHPPQPLADKSVSWPSMIRVARVVSLFIRSRSREMPYRSFVCVCVVFLLETKRVNSFYRGELFKKKNFVAKLLYRWFERRAKKGKRPGLIRSFVMKNFGKWTGSRVVEESSDESYIDGVSGRLSSRWASTRFATIGKTTREERMWGEKRRKTTN